MKRVDDVRRDVARQLTTRAVEVVSGTYPTAGWPLRVPLGRTASRTMADSWAEVRAEALAWRSVTEGEVTFQDRRIQGIPQQLPTHVTFEDWRAAATFAGKETSNLLHHADGRWQVLRKRFPDVVEPWILKRCLGWTSQDFEIAMATAEWLTLNPELDEDWTPRMVPVPGLHAKWLDRSDRRAVVSALAGREALVLKGRPSMRHIVYLDPQWRREGGRRVDVLTRGDRNDLAYEPLVVLVTENRDNAFAFPAVDRGIAVLGDGSQITHYFPEELAAANVLAYWGDCDVDGLLILNALIGAGHPFVPLLMDVATFDRYSAQGTRLDRRGGQLTARRELPSTPHLAPAQRELLERLADPAWTGPRRLEQERIPMVEAYAALQAAQGMVDREIERESVRTGRQY